MKICVACGVSFNPNGSRAIYCSVECYKEQCRERSRKQYQKNREQRLEQIKKQYRENPESHLEHKKKYRRENREMHLEYNRRWAQENPEKNFNAKHRCNLKDKLGFEPPQELVELKTAISMVRRTVKELSAPE